MKNKEAVKLLSTVQEGDLFSHGTLFANMDPKEPIFWRVLEAAETDEGRRITFHLYYRDIFLRAIIGLLTPDNKVQWGVRNA